MTLRCSEKDEKGEREKEERIYPQKRKFEAETNLIRGGGGTIDRVYFFCLWTPISAAVWGSCNRKYNGFIAHKLEPANVHVLIDYNSIFRQLICKFPVHVYQVPFGGCNMICHFCWEYTPLFSKTLLFMMFEWNIKKTYNYSELVRTKRYMCALVRDHYL